MMLEQLAGRCCLVTGAGGFIGKRLSDHLSRNKVNVVRWTRQDLDLRDVSGVTAAMSDLAPDIVFHMAAAGVAGTATHDPATIGTNCQIAANILLSMKTGSIMVAAGSMSEYGASGILSEQARCCPTTAYGISKLATTHFLTAYGPLRGVKVRVARAFGVYGPGEPAGRLFPSLLKGLGTREPVALSDGRQQRDFIHVDDLCDGLIRLAAADTVPSLVVNMGTGVAITISDICKHLARVLNVPLDLLHFNSRARSPGDADLLVADVSLLRATLDWVPQQRLNDQCDIVELLTYGTAVSETFRFSRCLKLLR